MIHTGRMVEAFHRRLDEAGIQRLHGLTLQSLSERKEGWSLETNHGLLNSTRVALCTNGLAKDMLPELDVAPVPNRVVVCRPATPSLKEGTYHLDRGYLYMRTLPDGLVLFGGGRHWGHALPLPPMQDLEAEQAWDQQLEAEARRWLGPIEAVTHRWTGWLGVGSARSHCSPSRDRVCTTPSGSAEWESPSAAGSAPAGRQAVDRGPRPWIPEG